MNESIKEAIVLLKAGELIGLPTETVYGLAADATNEHALKKIFQAKNRPLTHPLILHIATIEDLSKYAINIPEKAYQLAKAFWPGPLTLVLKKSVTVSTVLTAGQDTVAIRIPQHPLALEVIGEFKAPLAAPSANKFGSLSPTTAEAVKTEMGNEVSYVLDGGPCQVGLESTIVDFTQQTPRILRLGMISAEQIENCLQEPLSTSKTNIPRVSGDQKKHYSPNTPLYVLSLDEIKNHCQTSTHKLGVITFSTLNVAANVLHIQLQNEPSTYAKAIYQTLRSLDNLQVTQILVESPPPSSPWAAIADRLNRAASTDIATVT